MSTRQTSGSPKGCAIALLIGIGTVAMVVAVRGSWGAHLDVSKEWPFLLFSALLVAAPFGLLALRGVSNKVPWLVGLLLTILFWSGLVLVAHSSGGHDRAAGIGAGALMLLSPLIIGSAVLVAAHVRRA